MSTLFPRIALPAELVGLPLIASVSGGKDSTALMLALREAGLQFRAVFADTGWESPVTYAYLDELRELLEIDIAVVRAKRQMTEAILHRAGFPSRVQRWCTRELKIEPLRAYHDTIGDDTVCIVGVRAEESQSRAAMLPLEDEPVGPRSWGGWVWRPLLNWTVEDVLRTHLRHNVPVNPLYRMGFSRVGCYPCIYAQKEEIRLIAERSPERIAKIRELELACDALRAERNAAQPGRYAHMKATFFHPPQGAEAMSIDDVVAWSRTERGGRQLPLIAPAPTGGCMRWGLCDPPTDGEP